MIRRFLSEHVSALGPRQLKLLFKVYLPYLGAGIRVVGVADRSGKTEPTFTAEVRDDEDAVVAEVVKRIYVRRDAAADTPS